jgi:hypothetical protein
MHLSWGESYLSLFHTLSYTLSHYPVFTSLHRSRSKPALVWHAGGSVSVSHVPWSSRSRMTTMEASGAMIDDARKERSLSSDSRGDESGSCVSAVPLDVLRCTRVEEPRSRDLRYQHTTSGAQQCDSPRWVIFMMLVSLAGERCGCEATEYNTTGRRSWVWQCLQRQGPGFGDMFFQLTRVELRKRHNISFRALPPLRQIPHVLAQVAHRIPPFP